MGFRVQVNSELQKKMPHGEDLSIYQENFYFLSDQLRESYFTLCLSLMGYKSKRLQKD